MNNCVFIMIIISFLMMNMMVWASPPINIVVSVRGKKYDVSAETVSEVLEQVERMASLEEGQQHVLFRGKVLNDDEKLEDIGVSSGDVLNVVKKRLQRVSKSTEDDSTEQSMASASSTASSFGKFSDMESMKATAENMSPEDMKKAMQAMDNILDSNFIDEYFGDDEKLEKSRLQMLQNLDQYDNAMPGFKEQAQEIASDPIKWREAMLQAKEQILQMKQKRDAMKNKKNPSDSGSNNNNNNNRMAPFVSLL